MRLGGHVIPDDVIHDVTDKFFQLHGKDERCDDNVPRVLGVVVRRRTASCMFVCGAHARNVFAFDGHQTRQLRQLVDKAAVCFTQPVVPEAVGGGAVETPGLVD